jgi:hypothetical protein
MNFLLLLSCICCLSFTSGFAPNPLAAKHESPAWLKSINEKAVVPVAGFTTAAILPLVAIAEDDNYVYGAVDAPPLVPIIGGVLAILTALLPVVLRSGEEAFEEMKDKDGFGSGKDQLGKRK